MENEPNIDNVAYLRSETNCILDDAGIFIGFATMPIGKIKEFCKEEIEFLFKEYRQSLLNKFIKDNHNKDSLIEFEKYFYVPKLYITFGTYDLIIISVVDDFDFGARTFSPYDPLMSSKEKPYNRSNTILIIS